MAALWPSHRCLTAYASICHRVLYDGDVGIQALFVRAPVLANDTASYTQHQTVGGSGNFSYRREGARQGNAETKPGILEWRWSRLWEGPPSGADPEIVGMDIFSYLTANFACNCQFCLQFLHESSQYAEVNSQSAYNTYRCGWGSIPSYSPRIRSWAS